MQKVALVQPVIQTGKSLGIKKVPESVMVLAGVLEALGYVVRMFHAVVSSEFQTLLGTFDPDFLCLSTMTPNVVEAQKIARWFKSRKPSVPIILGGWHASGCVQAHLSGQESETIKELLNPNSPFDFVVAGEGEEALPYLLHCLEEGSQVQDGKGISYFNNGQMRVNPPASRVKDLGTLPWPSWLGLEVDSYRDQRSGKLDLSVHFNRSCRFRCGFCSTPVLYGQGVRTVPVTYAVEYLESVLERFKPQVITFTDEDFFAQPRWVEDLVTLLEEKDLVGRYGVSFDTFASVNDLHRYRERGLGSFLDRMKAVGFGSFTVGIESFNAEVLIRYNKELMILPTMSREERDTYAGLDSSQKKDMLVTHYRKRVQEVINFASEHGLLVVGDYMLGNPGETLDDVLAGFEIFKELDNLLVAYVPVFTPFPGTKVWADAYSLGLLPRNSEGNIDWARFDVSAGALDVGYNIEALRNELEIVFYTSNRYWRDMQMKLEQNPASKAFFLGRFTYLDREFPGDPRVQEVLTRLS